MAAPAATAGTLAPRKMNDINPQTLLTALREEDGGSVIQMRAKAARVLDESRECAFERIRSKFLAMPHGGHACSRLVADLVDGIVRAAWQAATEIFHPNFSHTDAERLAVVAVGGYGRREMAPYSDVDLLFLTPAKRSAWAESVAETMQYLLWDSGLRVGQAVRSVDRCLQLARSDMTIRTTLLETRLVCGEASLLEELDESARRKLFETGGRAFISAKLDEQDRRHEHAGGSRYLLNPDIKDGKGGLRDLQTVRWIARCVHGTGELDALVAIGLFDAETAARLARAENALWTYRFHLHYAAGRAEDRLHFGHQQSVAAALGYQERDGLLPVELFMRDYYRTARLVGELSRLIYASLEQRQEKDRPLARLGAFTRRKETEGFQVDNGRLTFESGDAMAREPALALRLFRASQVSGLPLHPDAERQIVLHLDRIDESMRQDADANAVFLSILTARGLPVDTLRRMREIGVLGRFLQEFDHIVGLMQFSTYHHYTVDEHTLLTLDALARIERGEMQEEHPLSTDLIGSIAQSRALRIALLLHDIGKGLGGSHSETGGEIAERICPRLGLDEGETETAAWLVRHHLAMSHTAQRRDIHDPATVRDFAAKVQETERLNLLLVMTVCDMTSVAPGYWNGWKAQLLRDLYAAALTALKFGQGALSTDEPVQRATSTLLDRLHGLDVEKFIASMPPAFWLGLDADSHESLARMALDADDGPVRLEDDSLRAATKVCLYAVDRKGILADVAASLAASLATVVELRTYTSTDGMSAAVLWVQGADGQPFASRQERNYLQRAVSQAVKSGRTPTLQRPPPALARFPVAVQVRTRNDASDLHTLLEVTAQDRPGLLADLARAINESGARIVSAVVSTYGERAVDSFYVKDSFGLKVTGQGTLRALERRVREAAQARPLP